MKMQINDISSKGQKLLKKWKDCTVDSHRKNKSARAALMECQHCGEKYYTATCEVHHRACPKCQDGAKGANLIMVITNKGKNI